MTWLLDKSALVKVDRSPDAAVWEDRVERGLVAVSTVTLLEVGFSARNGADHIELLDGTLLATMPHELVTPAIERRALDVQRKLANGGQHRGVSVADLIIAAVAEQSGRSVLHDDKDFNLIAAVTGQPLERLASNTRNEEEDAAKR